jgi:hypothetical protein
VSSHASQEIDAAYRTFGEERRQPYKRKERVCKNENILMIPKNKRQVKCLVRF